MMRPILICRVRTFALTVLLLYLGFASAVWAENLPAKGKVDERIRTTHYDPDQVYKLYGFVGYAIELVFEPGESFAGAGGGDLEGVTIDAHANSVLLKPKAPIVSTNLVIYTDRRAYRFDYSVAAHRPTRAWEEVMYAVRFLYPPRSADASALEAAEVDRDLGRAKSVRSRNTDYWYCGHRSLKPVAASDDGVQTRLTFSDRAEIPAIFVRNEDGTESLLNFSLDEGDVVIHRLAPRFILRRGRLAGCVVNQAFYGAGTRLKSGTVSPQVKRERKELEP